MKMNLSYAYTPYGYTVHRSTNKSLLGFNGELSDPMTGLYILGLGYRPYSVILMRFIATDSLAPFGIGGLNAYSYINGDPINYTDPSGHSGRLNARALIARRQFQKPPTHEKIVMNLDRPAQFSAPNLTDAPPSYSSHPQAFSSPVSPPPYTRYDTAKLPRYTSDLPPGHHRIITPTRDSSGKFEKPPAPPIYPLELLSRRVSTRPPSVAFERLNAQLNQEEAMYYRFSTIIDILERNNMSVPENLRRNLYTLQQDRDILRDALDI
ncbi:RHS repeat-associated core domain-containing protein [Pseudomonas juntendi]|uniref:RHS repeat-associated core domain-containing protein n=1 Tax=Pseudomonas juntendi TaxID=2666183 RepID=UPI001B812239|nr:RHS repeat-associated core domain-containing protein [Pseudomonas juntendi]MBR7523962.1 hypothetical protein [Pseudomonas juntendi]